MDNVFDYSETYYKITNKEENHNGFSFKDGLNEDVIPFNRFECFHGGIYFSDIKNIFRYLSYRDIQGFYVREVTVPKDADVSIEQNKYKASKIILGERKELNLDTIKYLVEQGADIHIDDEAVLQKASLMGQLDIVIYLVEQGIDIHTGSDMALIYASEYGHLDVVKYLVEQGADIHICNELALQKASKHGHLEVVKYLVEQGADIHTNNDIALNWAAVHGELDIVQYLVEQGANVNNTGLAANLKMICAAGNLDIIKYLVNKGMTIDLTNPLLVSSAYRYSQFGVVNYLTGLKRKGN